MDKHPDEPSLEPLCLIRPPSDLQVCHSLIPSNRCHRALIFITEGLKFFFCQQSFHIFAQPLTLLNSRLCHHCMAFWIFSRYHGGDIANSKNISIAIYTIKRIYL